MRKISITLIIALLISSSLLAQKKKWGHFGLTTGLNYSTIQVKGGTAENDWKTGFVLGAFVKIPVSAKAAIQPEFLYSSMGGNLTFNNIPPTHNYRFNYFSIPVLVKYNFCKSWTAVVGPQIDCLIQGKTNGGAKITNSLNEFGFGATGGVELAVKPAIVLGLRYMYGFTNALNTDIPNKWINHGAQLTIGFNLN